VEIVYCDIAQPDQTDIAIENCKVYLQNGGELLLVVKSRSIDVVKDPRVVIKEEAKKLESSGFSIKQIIDLEPFDKDHGMIYATYTQKSV
jgi:fibrillarin-like pre-rRNA processing protein